MTCILASNNQYAYALLGEVSLLANEMHLAEKEFGDAVMRLAGLGVNW